MRVNVRLISAVVLAVFSSFGIVECKAQATESESAAYVACPQSLVEFNKQRDAALRLLKEGNTNGALRPLSSAYKLCPADHQNTYDLALAEVLTGENEKARSLIGDLLNQQNRPELHTLLGTIESSEKNYTAAAQQYQKAAQMNPSEPNIFDFGTALFRVDWDSAEKILRFGIEKYPKSVRLQVALGTMFYGLRMPEEGAAILCNAAEIDPSDLHPIKILADTEVIPPALLPRVVSLLLSLQRRYPEDGTILFDYTMAKSGRWSGDKDAVPPGFVETIHRALLLNPLQPQAYFVLGLVNAQEGRYSAAITFFKKAIALKPDKDKYHYHLAFAYRKAGNESSAKEEIRLFQELHAQNTASEN